MEDPIKFIEPLVERAEAYGRTSYELLKLKTVDRTASLTSSLASRGLAILFLSMFTVVANIGIALWLGELLGKTYLGFFCVSAFYGIVGGILYFFMHKRIKNYISNSIISQLLS
ncbi:MAG: hypothetical protein JWO09_2273 [Bacteroidetes bacterium]|nr:hypothetical protein [Bacteroidota bacterium]